MLKEFINRTLITLYESVYKFRSQGCRILLYHSIGAPLKEDALGLMLAPKTFSSHMQYLKDNHYNVISLSKIVEQIENKEQIPPKSVAITFDDGTVDNYEFAMPILENFGFPATIYIPASLIGKKSTCESIRNFGT